MIRRPPRSTLFPTRRSSDLVIESPSGRPERPPQAEGLPHKAVSLQVTEYTSRSGCQSLGMDSYQVLATGQEDGVRAGRVGGGFGSVDLHADGLAIQDCKGAGRTPVRQLDRVRVHRLGGGQFAVETCHLKGGRGGGRVRRKGTRREGTGGSRSAPARVVHLPSLVPTSAGRRHAANRP